MKLSQSPHLNRFLSDFTLGFSDGLTVPFALTAGLSSLGSTDTVISGGLAELCAGSISMGIGGYLAARDEIPQSQRHSQNENDTDSEDEMKGMLSFDGSSSSESGESWELSEKDSHQAQNLLRKHLEPLHLPAAVTSQILSAIEDSHGSLERSAAGLQSYYDGLPNTTSELVPVSPIFSGVSISLGYTIGAVIPLSPYFFAGTVGAGFRWSLSLCLVALFVFGSGKSWALRKNGSAWRCAWEGLQMLVLGMMAAGAAVGCVMLVEGNVRGHEGGS
ncbi:Ccc1 family [Thelonectria olida]|uniref:Ccc1 family n=1 Tax=Thelonectria olida TaxID=1576542 RepID=A0A9P9ANC0_9HYPO|nr:Ccc1 family [Thelonectria olida]